MTNKKNEVAIDNSADDLDLSALDVTKFANEGTEIAIKHPVTGKPIGFYISILGKDGDVYKEIIRERSNETLKKAMAAEATGEPMQPPTYDEQQERELELLAALTTGWRQENGKNSVKLAGEEYQFNANNAKMIYKRFDFIRNQVDKAIADTSLFMKG